MAVAGIVAPLAFQCESIVSAWADAIPLMHANHAESGALPEEHFNPNLASFEAIERAGLLRTYTMRLDGQMIGYAVFVVAPHLTYPTLKVATAHVVYVTPEHRGRRTLRFLEWVREQLKADGCHFWGLQNPVKSNWARTLTWFGLRPVETFYIGEL